uniref:Uncharacterized protein n=1 Tax=Strigamia maritima TaxID=126957 RepID=T1JDV1_STRMM
MTSLNDKATTFNMHENTKVRADLCSCDVDVLHLFVKNLQTPLGKQPVALLRTSDVISLKIEA